jgi:uncharacterized protein
MIQPPVSLFVVKVTNRCNLACERCYYLKRGAIARQGQPPDMSVATLDRFVHAVGEYAADTQLRRLQVIIHGGEPLLRPVSFLVGLAETLRAASPSGCRIDIGLQTNGTRLTPEVAGALSAAGMDLSVSIDGPASVHDRVRRFRSGRGSLEQVRAHVAAIPPGTHFGILSVVDLEADPAEVLEFLSPLNPGIIDFLLPDGTHDDPPPGVDSGRLAEQSAYGIWLARLYDIWRTVPGRYPPIRMFENIIHLAATGRSRVDGMGPRVLDCLTIQTDGEICDDDTLDAAGFGRSSFGAGWHVGPGSFQKLQQSPEFLRHSLRYLPSALAPTCRTCDLMSICAGGHLVHRWSNAEGFNAPSIHCGSLRRIITHVLSNTSG